MTLSRGEGREPFNDGFLSKGEGKSDSSVHGFRGRGEGKSVFPVHGFLSRGEGKSDFSVHGFLFGVLFFF